MMWFKSCSCIWLGDSAPWRLKDFTLWGISCYLNVHFEMTFDIIRYYIYSGSSQNDLLKATYYNLPFPMLSFVFNHRGFLLLFFHQDFAKQSLGYLLNEKPPLAVIQQLSLDLKAKAAQEGWFEDLIKLCLYLFLALLPVNHKLIHEWVTTMWNTFLWVLFNIKVYFHIVMFFYATVT